MFSLAVPAAVESWISSAMFAMLLGKSVIVEDSCRDCEAFCLTTKSGVRNIYNTAKV